MLRYLIYFSVSIARIFLVPLYVLSEFTPRDKKLWVFGSWGGDRYADNSAAFFEFCNRELDDEFTLVWISRRASIVSQLRHQGYRAHLTWSPAGLWFALRANLHLFDCFSKDINFWASAGATKVCLWSGVPLKVFERSINVPGLRYYYLFHGNFITRLFLSMLMPWHVVRPDLIIASSEKARQIIAEAFDVPLDIVHTTGLPRNDQLLRPSNPIEKNLPPRMIKAVEAGHRTLMYLPTLRDKYTGQFDLDWDNLNAWLAEKNCHLFLKLHPVDKSELTVNLSNICVVERSAEIYDMLPHVDALISDYSSIIWDYMLLDRPIIYFLPDHEEFINSGRALNFGIHEHAVGPVCNNEPELTTAIRQVITDGFPSILQHPEYRQICADLNTYVDSNSAQRTLNMLDDEGLYEPTTPTQEAIDCG
jgi:CDP-glycerol glycerophosphotransferase (TagB/SpsB family)